MDKKQTGILYFFYRLTCIAIITILFSILVSPLTIKAGEVNVDSHNIFINQKYFDPVFYPLSKKTFMANQLIEIEFSYDLYTYAGKNYAYAVFKVFKDSAQKNPNPIGYFISPLSISKNNGFARFHLPEPNSTYEIQYYISPYFAYVPINKIYGGYLEPKEIALVRRFYDEHENSKITEKLIMLRTQKAANPLPEKDITIYIKNPSKILSDIDAVRPLTFEWETGPESTKLAKNIQFSYRLYPIEDWTIYSGSSKATYEFLRPRNYVFQVKAKYTINGVKQESATAQWRFELKKQIFSLSKGGSSQEGQKQEQQERKKRNYSNRRALLIGVHEYSDIIFPNLPYTTNDVNQINGVLLHKYRFKIDTLISNTTKKIIIQKMDSFLNQSQENEEIILYFSGHGTSIGENAYLVPSDGRMSQIDKTCIGFDYLENWINEVMNDKHVKHVLIILDSCQSGLGLLSKSSNRASIRELAEYPGAHMITAGLMGQAAQADRNKTISIFTFYLTKGLNGAADYNKGGVITLSELLFYVQDNVAKYVETNYKVNQTPVLGKIKGAGEMLFFLKD
jgi:hypothetical protein